MILPVKRFSPCRCGKKFSTTKIRCLPLSNLKYPYGTISILRNADGGVELKSLIFVTYIWTADNQLSVCTESAWKIKLISLSIHLCCDLLRRAKGAGQKFFMVFYAWYT